MKPAVAAPLAVGRAPGRPAMTLVVRPAVQVGDQRWDLLLVCAAGYILTAVGRVHQIFTWLEAVRPTVIMGLGATCLYLLDRADERRFRKVWCPTTKYLLALLVWMIVAIPTALVISDSFDLTVNNFTKTVLMFVVIAGTVRGPRDVERLTFAYLIGAALYAVVVIVRFDIGEGDNWRLGHLYYYDANDFATFAVTAMPFGLYFVHAGRRMITRALAIVCLGVLMVAFLRCGSRGGLLALAAVMVFVVTRYAAIALRYRVVAAAIVVGITLAAASSQYWSQFEAIGTASDYNRTADTGRLQIWQRGIGYMLTHPLFGVGPNNFSSAEGRLSPQAERQQYGLPVKWNAPHNTFVQVGAELGMPGLLLFLLVLGSAFGALRTSRRHSAPEESALAQSLNAALLGFVVGAFFLSLAYSDLLYTLIALAVGVQKISTGTPARPIASRCRVGERGTPPWM